MVVVAALFGLSFCLPTQAAEFSSYDTGESGVHAILRGEIKLGDELKFKKFVQSIVQQGKWIERIYLISPGGAMPAALSIGEQIYLLRMSTFAPIDWRNTGQPRHFICQAGTVNMEYFPDSHRGNPQCTCASACFFIWAAGRGRNGGVLGIHRIKFDRSTYAQLPTSQAESLYNGAMQVAKAYLHKMGIPDNIADLSFSIGSDDIRYLTPQEYGPLIGIGTPYLEELATARCGSYTPQLRESDQLRMKWWSCYNKIRQEEVRGGITEWQKAFP